MATTTRPSQGTRLRLCAAVILALTIVPWACKKQPQQGPAGSNPSAPAATNADAPAPQQPPQAPNPTAADTTAADSPQTPPADDSTPTLTIEQIIRSARTWGPVFGSWYGKQAPDFTISDLAGKQHRLSDYRGKNVMLVFWATWCGPCMMEVPHLVALRNRTPKDKLAILAISYVTRINPRSAIEQFASRNPRVNYTILAADESQMPAPFNSIRTIPCSFFIRPEGTIKLATAGVLDFETMRAIINAK